MLGAYRDCGVIKNDEDDIDFAVPYCVAEFKMKQIMDAFISHGFELYRIRPTVMTFRRNGSKIDLLFYKELTDEKKYYLTLYHNKRPFALTVPCKYWDNLREIEFLDEKFLCPEDIEGYLEWRFGDWKTPILRPHFGFQSYIENNYNKNLTQWLR